MRRLLIIALVCTAACDRKKATQPSTPDAGAAGTPAADGVPDEIITREMSVGPPLTFQTKKNPTFREVMRADDGEVVCMKRLLADENRLVAASSPECGYRARRDVKWSLYATDTKRKLLTFDDFLAYGDAFDTITVHGGVEKKTWTIRTKNPDGTTSISQANTLRIPTFVNLSDGSTRQVPGDVGHSRYYFVHGGEKIVVTHTVWSHGGGATTYIGLLDGIPKKFPDLTTPDPVAIRGDVRYDADRDLYLFHGGDCRRATLTPDASKVTCEVRLPDTFQDGRFTQMTDDWFVSEGRAPKSDPALAINLTSGKQRHPAHDLCADPLFPTFDRTLDVPRLVIGCRNRERSAGGMQLYVWTPRKRLEVPGENWHQDAAEGDLVEFYQLSIAAALHPSSNDNRWLDLRRLVLWKADGMFLAGHDLATDSPPMSHSNTKKVFLIDPKKATLRPLGEIACRRHLKVVHRDEEIVSVGCPDYSAPADETCRPAVDHTVTWDLREHTRIDSKKLFVGATRDALVFSDAPAFGHPDRCPPTRLLAMDRKP